eukprot:g560.t1
MMGAGGCGKSTIFKQVQIVSGHHETAEDSFTPEERKLWGTRMHAKLLQLSQKVLIQFIATGIVGKAANEAADQARKEFLSFDVDLILSNTTTEEAESTWQQCIKHKPFVTAIWAKRQNEAMEVLDKNFKGLMDDSERKLTGDAMRINDEAFLPSNDDILQFRYPTHDVLSVDYTVPDGAQQGVKIKFFDMGGQANERKKWNEMDKKSDLVLFVVALDDYHKMCAENVSRNRMTESLLLFKMVLRKHMGQKPVVLFLNKADLFMSTLPTKPLKDYYPEFTGKPDDSQAAVEFLTELFVEAFCAIDPDGDEKGGGGGKEAVGSAAGSSITESQRTDRLSMFTCMVTCAIDTEQMTKIIKSVTRSILSQSLNSAGFL